MHKYKITNAEGGAAFQVMVKPNASANRLTGKENDIVQIDLTAAPEPLAIDQALIAFLATQLALEVEKITVTRSKSTWKRVVMVTGITPEEIEKRLFG